MADEMMAGEQAEDQALQQILQLCQSGDPAVLQQIGEIVQKLLAHNQEEEKSEGGAPGVDPRRAAMVAAVQKQMGGGQPQPGGE